LRRRASQLIWHGEIRRRRVLCRPPAFLRSSYFIIFWIFVGGCGCPRARRCGGLRVNRRRLRRLWRGYCKKVNSLKGLFRLRPLPQQLRHQYFSTIEMQRFATRLRPLAAGLAGSALAYRAHQSYSSADPSALASSPPPTAALDALDHKAYDNGFRGQLMPELPKAGSNRTKNGPVVKDASGISWQRGPYGSWWMRLGAAQSGMPTVPELSRALDIGCERAKDAKSPLYVCVQELEAEPGVTALLRARGFGYHHFSPNEPPRKSSAGGSAQPMGEHVYYRWFGDPGHDMVPCYATSIEGVGALVLSPDEKKVLLVWEYGNWKPVSGAVDEVRRSVYPLSLATFLACFLASSHSALSFCVTLRANRSSMRRSVRRVRRPASRSTNRSLRCTWVGGSWRRRAIKRRMTTSAPSS